MRTKEYSLMTGTELTPFLGWVNIFSRKITEIKQLRPKKYNFTILLTKETY